MKRRISLIILLSSLCLPCLAQQDDKPKLDRASAAQAAGKAVEGRILKVEGKDPKRYRVKVLQKTGRVVTVNVDKNTGKVSRAIPKKK